MKLSLREVTDWSLLGALGSSLAMALLRRTLATALLPLGLQLPALDVRIFKHGIQLLNGRLIPRDDPIPGQFPPQHLVRGSIPVSDHVPENPRPRLIDRLQLHLPRQFSRLSNLPLRFTRCN